PRHADEGPQLRADAGRRHLDHGPARHAFPRRIALARYDRNGTWRRQVRPDFRHLRSGGVLRRQMRCIGAIGIGAARRSHTQADGFDAGYPGEFSALDSLRSKAGVIEAAMLAALIVGIAIWPSRFYREDLRIPMDTAGPCGRDA